MFRHTNKVLQSLGFLLLAWVSTAVAAEPPAGPLAEIWVVTARNGEQAEFEAAFRKYMDLSRQQNDPRVWDVYVPYTGAGMNRYVIRSCCHDWASQDAYESWNSQNTELIKLWTDEVNPHVEALGHYFYETDFANSHWPEELTAPPLVGVSEYSLVPGKVHQFHAARAELSQIAINQGWAAAGNQWSWSSRIGGEPAVDLIIPFSSFAAMTPGEQTIDGFLAAKMGEEKAAALMEEIASSVSASSYTIWMHRPDLSSRKD